MTSAAVVDEVRNRNKSASFLVLSVSVNGSGVHVIAAVAEDALDACVAYHPLPSGLAPGESCDAS